MEANEQRALSQDSWMKAHQQETLRIRNTVSEGFLEIDDV